MATFRTVRGGGPSVAARRNKIGTGTRDQRSSGVENRRPAPVDHGEGEVADPGRRVGLGVSGWRCCRGEQHPRTRCCCRYGLVKAPSATRSTGRLDLVALGTSWPVQRNKVTTERPRSPDLGAAAAVQARRRNEIISRSAILLRWQRLHPAVATRSTGRVDLGAAAASRPGRGNKIYRLRPERDLVALGTSWPVQRNEICWWQ